MGLEDKVQAAESECGSMQREWARRQQIWKLPFRMVFLLPFYAQYYGPDKIESGSVVVFDSHELSPDPVFLVGKRGFVTAVAKEDTALLSRIAKYFGGIMVPDNKGKEALREMKEQLYFHLDQSHIIEVFPFADVNGSAAQYGILRAAMQWEQKTGIPLNYVAATLRYSNVLPFFRVWHMPKRLRNWPWPFLTRATLYVSDKPLSSGGLQANYEGSKMLLSKLNGVSASLPEHYRRKGVLQAFYTYARQFFSG